MNKKFTMVCASLLLASAFSVNAQTTPEAPAKSEPVVVEYAANPKANQIKAINLADGVKFYMVNDNQYYKVTPVTTKDGKSVVTLGPVSTTESKDASVFEIRNFKKNGGGSLVQLYVDGKLFVTNVDASAAVNKAKNLAELNNTFFLNEITTAFTQVKTTAALDGMQDVEFGAKPATTQLNYKEGNLKEYNAKSTTFSFDFSDSELVGNEFKNVIPVTLENDENNAKAGTYFVKGNGAKDFKPGDATTYKDVEILAINPSSRYGLNTTVNQEGYALYWMKAEKALTKAGVIVADSTSLGAFTSLMEKDQLNNAGVLSLKVKPDVDKNANKSEDDDVFKGVELSVAAVKASKTDTKAYVTTVSENTNWSVVKDAMLGDNTYLSASDFLKKDAINTVAILVVNGAPGASNYYKYVTLDANQNITYAPSSKLDFSMAHNQWIVTDFDGKYTLTLQNRLDANQKLELQLAKTETGYEVVDNDLTSKDEDGDVISAVVKFLPIETTATDGYMTLTDEQIKDGIKLSFAGKTDLAGEKEFFGVNTAEEEMIPALEASNIIVFEPVRNLTKDDKEVYVQGVEYAYLDANGDVKKKVAENNLVVPTYVLVVDRDDKGNITKRLDADYSVNDAQNNHVFAFAKNMAGNYSLVAVTDAEATVGEIAAADVIGVRYNASSDADSKGLEFATVGRYNADNVNIVFANVNVLSNVVLNNSLPAQQGHFTFDNERGSISMTDIKGINEGALATEGMVFWLDSVDTDAEMPAFYISRGIEGNEAARMYMYNTIDSAKVFDEASANYKYNDVYFYGEDAQKGQNPELKVGFAAATEEAGKDLADQFKFNITLKDAAVADEYILSSVKKISLPEVKDGEGNALIKDAQVYVSQKNGVVILTTVKDNAMAFTVNPAEAPTSNESVVASEVKVVANNGSVVVKNAAGKNVVVSTILGQVVANEVLTSDNATINVPAGIVVVAVDGESFKVNVK